MVKLQDRARVLVRWTCSNCDGKGKVSDSTATARCPICGRFHSTHELSEGTFPCGAGIGQQTWAEPVDCRTCDGRGFAEGWVELIQIAESFDALHEAVR